MIPTRNLWYLWSVCGFLQVPKTLCTSIKHLGNNRWCSTNDHLKLLYVKHAVSQGTSISNQNLGRNKTSKERMAKSAVKMLGSEIHPLTFMQPFYFMTWLLALHKEVNLVRVSFVDFMYVQPSEMLPQIAFVPLW